MTDATRNDTLRTHVRQMIADRTLTPEYQSPEIAQTPGVCPDCDHASSDHPASRRECILCPCGHGADTNVYQLRWMELNTPPGYRIVGRRGYEILDRIETDKPTESDQ